MRFRIVGLFVFLLSMLAVLGSSPHAVNAQSGPLDGEVDSAAREYQVPKELLLAMGYVNTRWEMPPTPSQDKGWGIMHLVQNPTTNTLGEASRLTRVPEDQLKKDRKQNIRGGAALLAQAQGSNKSANLNDWYDAVAKSGGGALYANQVYEALQKGASATISTGEKVTLPAQKGVAPRQLYSTQSSSDYPGATWYPANSNNYTPANRPSSNPINKIIIHVTQGSYSSALNWFANPSAQTSAHYVIRSSDGAIGQAVHNKDIAWHAGNWTYNQTSIGIEHEGYVNDPKWFTDAMYRSSAKLAASIAVKYKIPIDRQHIIGHYQVPGTDHTDPGPYWDWNKYMSYVREYAGAMAPAPAPAYSQAVDNMTPGRFSASGNWGVSSWNSQKFGTNYRYTTPKPVSDAAVFKVNTPTTGNYNVYAWWPANPGYNSSTPVGIATTSGVKWVRVDQRYNGGRWVYLGTFNMAAGDGWKIYFSRWTTAKGYVVADAVRIVRK